MYKDEKRKRIWKPACGKLGWWKRMYPPTHDGEEKLGFWEPTCVLDLWFAGNGWGHNLGGGLVYSPRSLQQLGQVWAVLISFHLPGPSRLRVTQQSTYGSWQIYMRSAIVTHELLKNHSLWGQPLASRSSIKNHFWLICLVALNSNLTSFWKIYV